MNRFHRRTFGAWAATAVVALALAVGACGDDDDDDDDGDTGGDDLVSANVDCSGLDLDAPAAIAEAGTILVGSDLSYAPIDFASEGSSDAIGLDADLINCIAEAWGVEAEITNFGFDALIPALQGSQIDIIASAMTNNEERRQEISFVDYFTAGSGVLVAEGNPEGIATLADLCGLEVAIQLGTVQVVEAEEANAECDDDIAISTYETNTDAVQALVTDRASAALMDFPVAAYNAAQVGGLEVVGEQYNTGQYGLGIRQEDTEFGAALEAALEAMREGGQYDEILEYWGLTAGAYAP